MQWGLAGRLAYSMRSRVIAECWWPWPGGIRLQERLTFAIASGLVFIVSFYALVELADLFNKGSHVSLFFPIAALWLLFGYAMGPAYLAVPIIGVFLAEALPLPLVFVEGAMLHIVRQGLLYGAAGSLLRCHLGKRGQVTWSYRLGALLCVASVAVLANLLAGLPLFAHDGWLVRAELPSFALTFVLGDLSGLLLVVPPALLLLDRWLDRRRGSRVAGLVTWHRWVTVLCLLLAAMAFVVIALLGFSGETGFPTAVTPALLPILLGATLFGYAVGVGLFSVTAALLLAVSASIADPPSALVLHTVLIVCCVATLAVGAAASDRSRLIARLDASVAERTQMLDARNARLTELNAELQTVASTDHLTQLPNRRSFDLAFEDRLAAPDRKLGLLLIDVDRFKRINDRHGHAVGDEALVHVARLLAAALRNGDFVARVGGEEFAVLCCVLDCDDLHGFAERLRRAVGAAPLRSSEVEDRLEIRVSIGGALAGPRDDADSMLREADRALYAAKRAGRDRTRIAGRSIDRSQVTDTEIPSRVEPEPSG